VVCSSMKDEIDFRPAFILDSIFPVNSSYSRLYLCSFNPYSSPSRPSLIPPPFPRSLRLIPNDLNLPRLLTFESFPFPFSLAPISSSLIINLL
jgi:hypothetical protein